jgi:hypothetical protein
MTATRFRVQGITDDCTTCECCGRANLKRTVLLVELDADGNDADSVYYGVDCAARATATTSTRIRNAAAAGNSIEDRAASWARQALPEFEGISDAQYLAANPSVGTLAAAAAGRAATVAEARQILSGGGLAGTRFAREVAALPVVVARTPARLVAVSPAQATLF